MSYKFRDFYIPDYMVPGIIRYIEKGIRPGDFLTAVLSNDLRDAIDHGDDTNIANLPAYIAYFYNNVPSISWGSREKVQAWINKTQEEREEILKVADYNSLE